MAMLHVYKTCIIMIKITSKNWRPSLALLHVHKTCILMIKITSKNWRPSLVTAGAISYCLYGYIVQRSWLQTTKTVVQYIIRTENIEYGYIVQRSWLQTTKTVV